MVTGYTTVRFWLNRTVVKTLVTFSEKSKAKCPGGNRKGIEMDIYKKE